MPDSITVTREQVVEELLRWLYGDSKVAKKYREDLVESFTTALFNREESEIPRRHDPAQYDRLVEAFEGLQVERDTIRHERDAALERAEAAEKEIARLLQITNQVEWGPFDGPCNDCGHHEAEGHTSACIYRILATPLPTEGD